MDLRVASNVESLILYCLAAIFGVLLYTYSKKRNATPIGLVALHAILFMAAYGVLTSYVASKAWQFSSFTQPGYIVESISFVVFSIAGAIGALMFFRGKVLDRYIPDWIKKTYAATASIGFLILVFTVVVNLNY